MYTVYQPWDPLEVCVVGQSYPPEFYSWMKSSRARDVFEQLAIQTEEDYQQLIKVLKNHNVQVVRPQVYTDHNDCLVDKQFVPPPMQPRNHLAMVGSCLHQNVHWPWEKFYSRIKDPEWPDLDFDLLPSNIQAECIQHGYTDFVKKNYPWAALLEAIAPNVSEIKNEFDLSAIINGAMISRIGRDLYFSTEQYNQDQQDLLTALAKKFPDYRCHIVNTGGHGDGVYCPVVPGLIISTQEDISYQHTFPGWEVVRVPDPDWSKLANWSQLKQRNHGRWWMPGHETDTDVIDTVEHWLANWTGYVEESVFDVNMLVIDTKNVIVCQENEMVFRALERYGVTAHVVPFRHRHFWDGGIHCMTSDISRTGAMTDFFANQL